MKKQLLISFLFISLFSFGQVPQRFNKVIVTGDITSPKFIKTGSNADSVLLGNGSARAISAIKTDTVNLSNRINAKAAGNGTANGTNTGDETLTSIKTKLGAATAVSDGYLKYQDWSAFNSKEPAITKNSGFNLPLGNTTGAVLEGRTFGTAANSAVGDFIQNQYSLVQNANFNISGSGFLTGLYATGNVQCVQLQSTVATETPPFTVNSTTMVGNLNADLLDGQHASAFQPSITGLTTNYIPKWNGSNFVNSILTQTNNSVVITGAIPYIEIKDTNWNSSAYIQAGVDVTGSYAGDFLAITSSRNILLGTYGSGNVLISSTLQSTLPTNGALVVGGGIGANHVRANNFYGNGSNLTGIQLPITLTTNGTSGAATFSGNVLNVPNYAVSGGIDQTQTTFNGSTSGNIVCSMPFQTSSYKKVIIRFSSLNGTGTNTYTYPVAFTNDPAMVWYNYTGTQGSTTVGRSSIIFSGTASNHTGYMLLEGY